jgi:hypothetical protein
LQKIRQEVDADIRTGDKVNVLLEQGKLKPVKVK